MLEQVLPELAGASLIHGMVVLVTSIGLIANWRANIHIPGTYDFAICGITNALGFVFLGLSQYTGIYWLEVIANTFILWSFLATWMGLQHLLNRPAISVKLCWGTSLVMLVGMCAIPFVSSNPQIALFVFVGVFYSVTGILITFELFRPHLHFRSIRWTMGLISTLVITQQIYRTWFYSENPTGNLGLFDQLFYLTITLYAISMAMGAIFFTTQHLQSELMRLVDKDPLTNIYNRRAFRRIMAALHCRVRQTEETASLLAIDLDHFKSINDRYGHAAGDDVLVKVTEAIKDCIRGEDTFARIGGEEFIIVMEGTPPREVKAVAKRILEQIAALKFDFDNTVVNITASIGITPFIEDFASVDQAINTADMALYEAKRQGRNRSITAPRELRENEPFQEAS